MVVTAIDEDRLKELIKLRNWLGGTKYLTEPLRLEVHRLLRQRRRFTEAAVAKARPAAARSKPNVLPQPAVLPAATRDVEFKDRAGTIGVAYGPLPPDRFDYDSYARLGAITNFAYMQGRAGVWSPQKAQAPPPAARRHREAFRDMVGSLSTTYEKKYQDVVFVIDGSGRGGTFAAARKLLHELEFTGNCVLALHVDKDKARARARHALGTWGKLAHKVTAAVLPVEDGASSNEVTRAVLMAMDENGFSRSPPLILSLDQCCSALASNARCDEKNTHWDEFALALAFIVARFQECGLRVVVVVSEFPADKKDMLVQHAGWSHATHLVAGGASRGANRAFWVLTNLDEAARSTGGGGKCPFSSTPGGAKVLFGGSEFDKCGFVLNRNGHKNSIIGKACNWTSNSGGQLGDAGVSANAELPVSFELVKYLLALVGLVGSYDISTEAIKRHALVATTLSEHLDITCSARVRVVREHFV